jgi:large subunit ribosomal protein L9e
MRVGQSLVPAATELDLFSSRMKVLLSTGDAYEFPKEVKCEIKGRAVRIKGPRGTLSREFKHLAVDMFLTTEEGKLKLHVECHFGKRKRLASIRTVITHIENMVLGVTKGFEYKLRLVYQHFPININIAKTKEGGDQVEVRNFLGEKRVRVIKMKEGCKCVRSEAVKDEVSCSAP